MVWGFGLEVRFEVRDWSSGFLSGGRVPFRGRVRA